MKTAFCGVIQAIPIFQSLPAHQTYAEAPCLHMKMLYREVIAEVTCSAIPAKARMENRLNSAFGGTGFRVALHPEHYAMQGFACPE